MRWFLMIALFVATGFVSANEGGEGLKWYTNLEDAHAVSQESGKPIFGFFTGSDWCGWCHKLQREVFAKQAFIDWAKKNVVLMEIDFPRRTPQSLDLKTQNQNLQRAFGVTGYPTVWLFKSSKDEKTGGFNLSSMGKLGYPRGAIQGQEEVKFLANANAILNPVSSTPTNP